MLELRDYQQMAVEKLLWSRDLEGADLCVLPTGSGKSLVIASLAHKLKQPILILQPTKEILEQNVSKMLELVDPTEIGIFSASVGRKDTSTYTFATIQSIYKKPELFRGFGYIIIDEAHLVNPKNLDGMFTQFLEGIGNPKVAGMTATPWRMDKFYTRDENGGLWSHATTKLINRMKEHFWHRIIINVNIADLIAAGYLVPLRYIDKSFIKQSELRTNISKSDFDMTDFTNLMSLKQNKILEAIYFAQELGKHVLMFCASVEQAESLKKEIQNSEVVTAKSSKKERERIVKDFRSGKIQTVFNVGVLTTGFDFPELSVIIIGRPTMSIGLYMQMAGRGVRTSPGKKFCRLIDLTDTVRTLGRIETIKLVKRDQWELESETKSNWHMVPLYEFQINENSS